MKLEKCPHCGATPGLIRSHAHQIHGGQVRYKHCNICDIDLRSYQPDGEEERYIQRSGPIQRCGSCRHAATHFDTVRVRSYSGHIHEEDIGFCDSCWLDYTNPEEAQVKPHKVFRPKARRVYAAGVYGRY